MKLPEKYDAARRALAAATRFDEVKSVRDKALAMEVYAYQSKDGELAAACVELKRRAIRRLGELMAETPRAKGGQPHQRKSTGGIKPPVETLADQGVDKDLAKAARAAAKTPEKQYDRETAEASALAQALAVNNTAIIKAARAGRHKKRKAQRQDRELNLASKLRALPQKKYGVILADPEWKFETYTPAGLDNSSADNYYPTSALTDIKARDVPSIAAADCVLFLWATVPMLPQALEVMAAWGFAYKSSAVWVKDRAGTGYWFRNQHEFLLVGTKGKVPAPAEGEQWSSVISAPVGKHSTKPEASLELVEHYFPTLPKIELNRRGPARKGWDAWGNEAVTEAAE